MFIDALEEQLKQRHIRKRSILYNTGISTKRFTEIENGYSPTREELNAISDYLKWDIDEDKIKEYTEEDMKEDAPEETETEIKTETKIIPKSVNDTKPEFTEDDVLRNLKEIRHHFKISQDSLARMVNNQNKNFKCAAGQISVYERTRKGLAERYKRPIYRVFCSTLYKTETQKVIDEIKTSSSDFNIDDIIDNIGFIINYLHIDEDKLVSAIRLKNPGINISKFDILSAEESKNSGLTDEQRLAIYMHIINTYSCGQINTALYNSIYYKKENQLTKEEKHPIFLSKENLNEIAYAGDVDNESENDKSSDTLISDIIHDALDKYDGPTEYTEESLGKTILKYGTISTCTSVDSILSFLNEVDAGVVGPKEELISIIKKNPTDLAKLILDLDEVKSYLNENKEPESVKIIRTLNSEKTPNSME
jgi:transcriptional regulator with XRE-family HTH domain